MQEPSSNLDGDDEFSQTEAMMMEPLLSMLFSKDILYPSLKLMLDNFDKYLEDNKEKLSEQETTKCLEQKDYIRKMCEVYESAKESDSKEAKSEQLKKIIDYLEKCGMPPSELVPEVNPFSSFGAASGSGGGESSCPIQ